MSHRQQPPGFSLGSELDVLVYAVFSCHTHGVDVKLRALNADSSGSRLVDDLVPTIVPRDICGGASNIEARRQDGDKSSAQLCA